MNWGAIKAALNSSVGTSKMKQLDIVVEREAHDAYYYGASPASRVECLMAGDGIGATWIVPYGWKTTEGFLPVDVYARRIFFPSTLEEISESFIQTASAGAGGSRLVEFRLPPFLRKIKQAAFDGCRALENVYIPPRVEEIGALVFNNCEQLRTVVFGGKPASIDGSALQGCLHLQDVYVPWSEGEVAGAPWGATDATIHYNHRL